MFSATRSAASAAPSSLDVGDEHEELVASEPGDDVGRAHGVAEPVGDDAQELVAGRVAVAVVHELEVVEVDKEDGDRLVAARRARAIACSRCSWKSRRLGRSVRASW